MDKTLLVGMDVVKSKQLMEALEHGGLKISMALWLYSTEHEDWRLALASRELDPLTPGEAIAKVNLILRTQDIDIAGRPSLLIMKTTDPFVRELRKTFGKTRSVEGMRLGGQMIGNRFVEDAYAYRIA